MAWAGSTPIPRDCNVGDRKKIENVERVFMKSLTEFILMYRSSADEHGLTSIYGSSNEVHLFTDIAPDQPMWASQVRCNGGWTNDSRVFLDLHLHTPSSLEGGGYREGSSKSGTREGFLHEIR